MSHAAQHMRSSSVLVRVCPTMGRLLWWLRWLPSACSSCLTLPSPHLSEPFCHAPLLPCSLLVPLELRQLLCGVLATDPQKRMSAAQALQLPYFSSLRSGWPEAPPAGPLPNLAGAFAAVRQEPGPIAASVMLPPPHASSPPPQVHEAPGSSVLGAGSSTPRRVSALTARLRAQRGGAGSGSSPWEHDGDYVDLMPQVHALLAAYRTAQAAAKEPLVQLLSVPSTTIAMAVPPRSVRADSCASSERAQPMPAMAIPLPSGRRGLGSRNHSHSRLSQAFRADEDGCSSSPAKRMALTPMTPLGVAQAGQVRAGPQRVGSLTNHMAAVDLGMELEADGRGSGAAAGAGGSPAARSPVRQEAHARPQPVAYSVLGGLYGSAPSGPLRPSMATPAGAQLGPVVLHGHTPAGGKRSRTHTYDGTAPAAEARYAAPAIGCALTADGMART